MNINIKFDDSSPTFALFNKIKTDILNGKLLPNEKLVIANLKKMYNVGVGPLREVLSMLVSLDLVYMEHQKGYRVAPLSLDDMEDIYASRIIIEIQTLKLSLENGDDYWEGNLMGAFHLLNKVEGEIESKKFNLEEWKIRHNNFHNVLVSACPLKTLLNIRLALWENFTRYRNLWIKTELNQNNTFLKTTSKEHQKILEIALNRDIASITSIIETHFNHTLESLRSIEKFENLL